MFQVQNLLLMQGHIPPQNHTQTQNPPQAHNTPMNQSMNQLLNQNPPGSQAQNLNQGPTVVTIHAEPRRKDVGVKIVIRAGETTGDD